MALQLSSQPRRGALFAAIREVVPDGVNVKEQILLNPTGSGVVMNPYRFHAFLSLDTPIFTQLVYTLNKVGGDLTTVALHGQSLVVGGGTGVAKGGLAPVANGISGGYFWEGEILSDPTLGNGSSEIDEEFPAGFLLYPGTFVAFYTLNNGAHWWGNYWWYEYPL